MSDPAQYRSKKELENYKQKDPIEQVKNLLLRKKILSINEIELVDKNIKEQIKKSVDFAEKSPNPSKEEVFSDIYVQKDYPFIKE